jgi:antitoxin component YwqK of YwqJK toxin-antitoxin module
MKHWIIFCLLTITWDSAFSQNSDTIFLHFALSKGDTIIYKRIVSYNYDSRLYSVRDYYESGQIQMKADYSSLDKYIKEDYQCNYRSNTKEGQYEEWYSNGQRKYYGNFKKGKRNGICSEWYLNGQKEAEEIWENGQMNGRTRYWSENGELQYDLSFTHGEINNQKTVGITI